jgi:hypothetical protein
MGLAKREFAQERGGLRIFPHNEPEAFGDTRFERLTAFDGGGNWGISSKTGAPAFGTINA